VPGLPFGLPMVGAVPPAVLRRLSGLAIFAIVPVLQPGLAFPFLNAEDAEIMLRMLVHIFSRHPIPSRVGVARELQILLVHLVRVAANPDAGPVAIEILIALRRITTPSAAATGPLGTLSLSHITVMYS